MYSWWAITGIYVEINGVCQHFQSATSSFAKYIYVYVGKSGVIWIYIYIPTYTYHTIS